MRNLRPVRERKAPKRYGDEIYNVADQLTSENDVKTAFMHATLDCEIYTAQPKINHTCVQTKKEHLLVETISSLLECKNR